MPELSRFFGIVITMYARDHRPPHFHARFGEHEALFDIESPRVLRGRLPKRAHDLVDKWTNLHRSELRAAWDALAHGTNPDKIGPLS